MVLSHIENKKGGFNSHIRWLGIYKVEFDGLTFEQKKRFLTKIFVLRSLQSHVQRELWYLLCSLPNMATLIVKSHSQDFAIVKS